MYAYKLGGNGMKQQELMDKIAILESVNDQLISELGYVDDLMRQVGFSNGLQTVKATANEIKNQGWGPDDDFEEFLEE
jgi:hypothetical protein